MLLIEFFEPYLGFLKSSGNTAKTIKEHRRFLEEVIKPVLWYKKLDQLSLADVMLIMDAGRPHGHFGPQRSVLTFRRLCRFIQLSGYILPFDWRDIETPRVRSDVEDALTIDELNEIRDCFATNYIQDIRHRALIELLLDTGMRIKEACSIDLEDINWVKNEISIENCKTHAWEKVYFTDRSATHLRYYLDKRRGDYPFLFVSGRDRLLPVSARNYLRTKTKHLHFQNKRIHFHLLRKTYATFLIRNNVDIKTVQDLCRHASERTTLRYYASVDKGHSKTEHERVLGALT